VSTGFVDAYVAGTGVAVRSTGGTVGHTGTLIVDAYARRGVDGMSTHAHGAYVIGTDEAIIRAVVAVGGVVSTYTQLGALVLGTKIAIVGTIGPFQGIVCAHAG